MKKTFQYLWLLAVIFFALTFSPAAAHTQTHAENYTQSDFMPGDVPSGNQIALIFDGKKVPAVTPFINQEGHTLIAASELAELLDLQLDWVDNEQLQLSHTQAYISFRNGQPSYLKGEEEISIAAAPIKCPTGFFVPLRTVAEEFGLTIAYNANTQTVSLYTVPPPQEIPAVNNIDLPQNLGPWGAIASDSDLAALWGDLIVAGGYFTRLNNSPPNRTNNIILACDQINGTILKSGDIFSFNQVVGHRNTEKGYLPASIFVGREVVSGVGGGICQVSSTIYNGVLTAGLEMVERHPHTLPVNYIGPGYDATVLWGGADLRFKNNRENDLLVLTAVYGNYVTALFIDTGSNP